jgi:nucleoid-associated protein YgaU
VIASIEWGDCIRDRASGARLRQEVTLKLLEYREEQAIAQLPRAKATAKSSQKYKVKKGDNLKKIATKLLGKSSRWPQIVKANKGMRGWKLGAKWVGKTIVVPPK